ALPATPDKISFEDRFFPARAASQTSGAHLQPLDRFSLSVMEIKLQNAKSMLGQRLISGGWRADLFDDGRIDAARVDEARPSRTALILLPRSRPAMADLEVRSTSAFAQVVRPDERTLM